MGWKIENVKNVSWTWSSYCNSQKYRHFTFDFLVLVHIPIHCMVKHGLFACWLSWRVNLIFRSQRSSRCKAHSIRSCKMTPVLYGTILSCMVPFGPYGPEKSYIVWYYMIMFNLVWPWQMLYCMWYQEGQVIISNISEWHVKNYMPRARLRPLPYLTSYESPSLSYS